MHLNGEKQKKDSKLRKGILKKVAQELGLTYAATQQAWLRKNNPHVEFAVLNELHKDNELRLKSQEIRQQLNIN